MKRLTWQQATIEEKDARYSPVKSSPARRVTRIALAAFSVLVVLSILTLATVSYMFSAPRYKGPKSDHFDGKRFVNLEPIEQHGFRDLIKFMFFTDHGPWEGMVENRSYPPPPERVDNGDLQVTFINHSTVLIQMDGLNILTDPIWSERCSPVSWTGPKRVRAPGIPFDSLPPIDYILLSHNHYDHLDLPTLKRLAAQYDMPIITGLGNRALLEQNGLRNVVELDWGSQVEASHGITFFCRSARHFSGRGLDDRQATLWVSFLIKGPSGAVYFAGDTGFGRHFEEIEKEFGPVRLALIPIGAYLPRWFMKGVHVSPEEAVRAHQLLKASTSVAIHFGTFRLGADGQDQAESELKKAVQKVDSGTPRFWILDFGESRPVPAADQSAAMPPAAAM